MIERRVEKLLATYIPFPMCIVNSNGKITRASGKIDEVFIYDGIQDSDFFALTGMKMGDLIEGGKELILARNEKKFKVIPVPLGEKEGSPIGVYFLDITEQESLRDSIKKSRLCLAILHIDNYDELLKNTVEAHWYPLMTEVDKIIRAWGEKINSSITKFGGAKYFFAFEWSECEKLIKNKFQILDEVRNLETETDFPVTLSIGIGVGGKSPSETDSFSAAALDLALGRGGDQVVVKIGEKISYYGGKMQTVEKSNKGKSRMVGYALKQLIDQSARVVIMGHKNADMDAFGSALGIFRLAANRDKEAHIVLNSYNNTMAEVCNQAKESGQYSILTSQKAIQITDDNTLLVVVDTHRPSLTECPELLELTDKIVVIDHHRKAEESIENPILAYMEPYASSTAELVTEILQYVGEKKAILKLEAEAMLAGILVDTNRFSVKTGVRTFEAASWLRRAGADTVAVKRLFQSDEASFKIKSACVANAKFLENNMAISISNGRHPNIQVINSQAADELLEVKDIKASFVIGIDENEKTIISARSLGQVNVQLIMEAFGGGGHLTTAGAQVEGSPEETMIKLERILKEQEI